MRWSFRVGRISGIAIDFHLTFVLLILWLGVVQFYSSGSLIEVGLSLLFVILLFLSILLHELGHALAARLYGIGTVDITLLPIGGMARLARSPEKPIEEFVVALAGPLTNLVIGAALYLGLAASMGFPAAYEHVLEHGSMTTRLLMANLWLAAFNLLPAFPMDGGRIFRSLLALRWNRQTSTLVASRVAQGFAAAFIFAGFYPAFGLNANVLLAFIGIFIWITAQGELNRDSHADSMRSA